MIQAAAPKNLQMRVEEKSTDASDAPTKFIVKLRLLKKVKITSDKIDLKYDLCAFEYFRVSMTR
jgi:hypothetical protein